MARHSIAIITLALIALLGGACSRRRSEVLRVPSPDNRLVAVMTKDDTGGDAISTEYDIYLNEINQTASQGNPVLVATRCEHAALVWEGPKSLRIVYDGDCTIRRFVNRWYEKSNSTKDPSYTEILLSRR
jgi:hypothetical protein